MHGTYGEDGTIQGLLDLAGLPLWDRECWVRRLAWTKTLQETFATRKDSGSSVGDGVSRGLGTRPGSNSETDREEIPVPAVCKAGDAGLVVGMSKSAFARGAGPALDLAAEFAMKILVERAVSAREIEVSVLGNHDPQASVPGELCRTANFTITPRNIWKKAQR